MLRSIFLSLTLLFPVYLSSQSNDNNVQEALQNFQYRKVLELLDGAPSTGKIYY
jgi:hypothetical protein